MNPVLEPEAVKILTQFAIPYPKHEFFADLDEAPAVAERLGFPLVLKVVSKDILHKSEAGGVIVNVLDAESLNQAREKLQRNLIQKRPEAKIDGYLLCKQAPPGEELIIGAIKDATFGHALLFGLGGVFTEILKDVSFRILPITRKDAEEMIQEIKGYPLLMGARGREPADISALASVLVAVSDLVSAQEDICELDLNPVRIYPHGINVLDVRMIREENS